MLKQRIPPFLNNLPLLLQLPPTPSFPEKIFNPHPYCKIRGSQSPRCKGGGSTYEKKPHPLVLNEKYQVGWNIPSKSK